MLMAVGGEVPPLSLLGAQLPTPQTAVPPAQASSSPTAQTDALLNEGFNLLSKNEAAQAELAFRQAVQAQPNLAEARRGLGLALWSEGHGRAAIDELESAARLAPENAGTHNDLGRIAWTMSHRGGAPGAAGTSSSDYLVLAIDELGKARTLRPADSGIRLNLAEAELEANRPKDALKEASEATKLAPNTAAPHVTLGRAYFAVGEEDKAQAEYKTALTLDPASGDAHLGLGQIFLSEHRLPDAEKEFRLAIAAAPNSALAYSALAQILEKTGQLADERSLLEKAVALNPQDWDSKFRLARLLLGAGQEARATRLLTEVTRAEPDFPPAQEQFGLLELRRGDVSIAEARADSMIAKNPQAVEGHRLMALVAWKRRDFDTSLAECAIVIGSGQDSASMLALESIELWMQNQKKEARAALAQAGKLEPHLATAEVFCRLILCDAKDIGPVDEFLKKNRWVLNPPPAANQ